MAREYDKLHLVPFGEFSPFPFLEKIVQGIGAFRPGEERVLFDLADAGSSDDRLGVLICYEVIFPAEAREAVRSGATLLANITNDAWFGRLGAPVQHLEMSQVRAIESRVPLVRAANTGISAIVDPWGRVRSRTGLFEEGLLVATVRPGPRPGSLYLRVGDVFASACALAVAGAILAARAGRASREPRPLAADRDPE